MQQQELEITLRNIKHVVLLATVIMVLANTAWADPEISPEVQQLDSASSWRTCVAMKSAKARADTFADRPAGRRTWMSAAPIVQSGSSLTSAPACNSV